MKVAGWQFYENLFRGRYSRLVLSILLSAGQSLLIVPIAFLVRQIFDNILPRADISELIRVSVVILVLSLLNEAATLLPRYLSLNTTKLVIGDLRNDLLERCYQYSRSHFDSADMGKLHAVIVQDTQRLDSMTNALIALFMPALINIFALSCVLVYLNPTLFLVLLLTAPLLYLLNHLFLKKRLSEKTQASHRAFERFSKGMLFVLQMMDLTRTQAAEEFETNRQKINIEEVRQTGQDNAMWYAAYSSAQNAVTIIPIILILIIGGLAVETKTLSLGALLSFYVAVGLLKSYSQTMLSSLPYIIEGNESLLTLEKTFHINDTPPYTGHKKTSFTGQVSLDGVGFQYRDGSTVLQVVDLVIEPGSLVALMGPNGVGKSTIASLILGFYRPQKGQIFTDGCAYDTLDIVHLRKSIGVVPQEPVIFSGTILENITYGQPAVNFEEVKRAARLASADEFIQQLPLGYDTATGEQGVMLSGGQCQRIAIARALLRRPKLLILDEPTNHLDDRAIEMLLRNIKSLDENPSILLITHNREIAQQANAIYFLDENGFLNAEPGSHSNKKARI